MLAARTDPEVDPVLLVPRQLRRAGLTGDVPYYGGRFTPAQAHAAAHARPAPPPPPAAPPPPPPPPRPMSGVERAAHVQALQHLHASGVLTNAELTELRARVGA